MLMELEKAKLIAEQELERLRPVILFGTIAGSIRRQEAEVKDIELVVRPAGVFPDSGLYPADRLKKNGMKYKQIELEQGINLDLFIVTPPADWGVILTIRTGPKDFSHWIVSPRSKGGALPSSLAVQNGAVWRKGTGSKISCFNEIDFLNLLGLGWIEPKNRYPMWHQLKDENI